MKKNDEKDELILIKKQLREILTRSHESSITQHLIECVPILMKILSNVRSLKGLKKKELLLTSVIDYINEEEDPEDAAALFFINNVVDPLIDVLLKTCCY